MCVSVYIYIRESSKKQEHFPYPECIQLCSGCNKKLRHNTKAAMGIINFLSFSFFLLSLISALFAAAQNSYVVYLGAHSAASSSSIHHDSITESHYQFLASFLGSKEKAEGAIFYSYTRHINGFAAILDDADATEISRHPEVVSVFLNRGRKLHTTRSWDFMGLEDNGRIHHTSAWIKARFGEDTIIANLDTGVWPESKSFSDEGYGPVPLKWKGHCQNEKDSTLKCNRKLIGARYFNKGYSAAAGGTLNSTYESPRDHEGHGSHTLSTAGGNFVAGANIFGFANGTAKGGSPKARVAAYKVCWPPVGDNECFDADVLAAFDMAIHDGVDVISLSLGGNAAPFFNDSLAIGSFHAVSHGIVVVCSGGNSGPAPATVSNTAIWQITVGASTMDRTFPSYVVLPGHKKHLTGESLSASALPHNKLFPIVTAESVKAESASPDDAMLCKAGTLDPNEAKGKILVCLRGDNARVDKGQQAALAGAVGMILINDVASGNEVIADPHVLPASHLTYPDGQTLLSYLNSSTKSPEGYITRAATQMQTKPAPFMASFSSKGPNTITPEILKPDITAPGVSVLAAYTEAQGPTNQPFDKRRVEYNIVSGTSMSCPHISGIVGLLKTLYPDWSPAAIKSAIMTTARTRDNKVEPMRNGSLIKATPFDYGAGHVRPNRAIDPGLVYDLSFHDYLAFLCSLGYNETQVKLFTEGSFKCPDPISLVNLNYPSITIPNLNDSVTVIRTLKNVGSPGTYLAKVVSPVGVSVEVEPKTLVFSRIGEEKSFKLVVKLKRTNAARNYVFGRLAWSDGKHIVRSPIVVKASSSK